MCAKPLDSGLRAWSEVAPQPALAFVAAKAPGGAYHKNLFHQLEHAYCFLRKASAARVKPEVVLWPYTTMPLTRALIELLLPGTQWHETCCGREKVAARWWKGRREPCSCWQKVCPQRYAEFWPVSGFRVGRSRTSPRGERRPA